MTAFVVDLDNGTTIAVDMLRTHRAAEPDRSQYPEDDGHAQAAYWAAYDEWQSVEFGLRMLVGGRLAGLFVHRSIKHDNT